MSDVITKKGPASENGQDADALTGMAGAHPLGSGTKAAEAVSPAAEEQYWRETFVREAFYEQGRSWGYYAPAFRAGWEGRVRHDGRSFEDAEPALIAGYNVSKSDRYPDWQAVRSAAKAAWDRVDQVRGRKT